MGARGARRAAKVRPLVRHLPECGFNQRRIFAQLLIVKMVAFRYGLFVVSVSVAIPTPSFMSGMPDTLPIWAACFGDMAFGDISRTREVSPCKPRSRPVSSISLETRKPHVASNALQIRNVNAAAQSAATVIASAW